jgi:hypothetical protein
MSAAADIRLSLMSAATHIGSQKLRMAATFTENMLLVATFVGGGLDMGSLALLVPSNQLLSLKEVVRPRQL